MDFSNDDEIAELLNLSSSVIKEIQRAEVKGPQTLGQPQVAPGNTSHLKELWEKESGTQTKPEAKSGSDEHNALPEDVQGPPKTTDEQDKGPTARAEASVNTSLAHPDNDAPSDLDKALSKLEKKREAELNADKSLKKGTGGELRYQEQPEKGKTAPRAKVTKRKANQPAAPMKNDASESRPQQLPDTEGSIPSSMSMDQLWWKAGATQTAPQSELIPEEKNASAGGAQLPVSSVEMIMTMLKDIVTRVSRVEDRLSDISRNAALFPLVRNDINQLKATTALMSTQLASIQVLDPGNAGYKSLSEMKQASKQAVVIQAGYGDLESVPYEQGIMAKDELARPIPLHQRRDANNPIKAEIDAADIDSLKALIESLIENDKKKQKLYNQLDKIRTKSDYMRLKQQIYNS
ncbi:P [avian paramyxovirus 10]|uniref:Phosphoprotein n=2 Tax=Metaavulavirus falklandense TaxID=2560309 RepID=D9IL74_9MONO|nr:P [Avian paramyxovirus penguin/Falkland Islands/324/2007] [avian paramyxovirus 10]AQQ11602.1 P [Metaavulavirus falklandense] [Metaavulavirus falklandense]ADK12972.2 P [Avian paramyxovirus penguin/Falkland Islands/324/2007] [avian paramyxovirus 10]BAW94651.1 phosphoprotein [Metaavulavirus falklandense]BAW94657.1 phosphoprotein [Metaavulavirus falklandense]BBJ77938.1 phosphoprotein [Metaavulavirus falklandense]